MSGSNRCDCCYNYGCDACTGGGPVDLSLQATVTGFTQVNTPGGLGDPDPCSNPGECGNLNITAPLGSGYIFEPVDAGLLALFDVEPGTDVCAFYYTENHCSSLGSGITLYEINVVLYRINGGGVGAWIGVRLRESTVGYNGCSSWFEALVVVDAGATTIDCSSMSFSGNCTFTSSSCFGGGPGPVWCGGTINVLIENAP